MSQPEEKSRLRERLGLFGDLPTRLLCRVLKFVPCWMENFFICWCVLLFYLLARDQRRAVISNLRVLYPRWNFLRAWGGGYAVFWNFGRTYVDMLRFKQTGCQIHWEVEGAEHLRAMLTQSKGLLLVTAHMGNYDLAASHVSKVLQRKLHMVRAPERVSEMQSMRVNSELEGIETHYNTKEGTLGHKLARLLMDGEIVAVQADRVVGKVSSMTVALEPDLEIRIPRGPWVLSCLQGINCLQVIVTRCGSYSYKISMSPLTYPTDRTEAQIAWSRQLLSVARSNWQQWYVFEEVLMRRGAECESSA